MPHLAYDSWQVCSARAERSGTFFWEECRLTSRCLYVPAANAIGGAWPALSVRTQRRQTPRHAGGSCLPRGALLQPQPLLTILGHRHRHPHQHHSRAAAAAVRPPWRFALQHSGIFAQGRGGFVSGPVDLLPPSCQGWFSGCGVFRHAATGAGLWIGSKATLSGAQNIVSLPHMLSDESARSWEAYRSYCCNILGVHWQPPVARWGRSTASGCASQSVHACKLSL